jgi:hypothetical protein
MCLKRAGEDFPQNQGLMTSTSAKENTLECTHEAPFTPQILVNESWLAQRIREDREERQAALDRSQQRSGKVIDNEEEEEEEDGAHHHHHHHHHPGIEGTENPAASSENPPAAVDVDTYLQDAAETLSDSYESQPLRGEETHQERPLSISGQTSQHQQHQQQEIASALNQGHSSQQQQQQHIASGQASQQIASASDNNLASSNLLDTQDNEEILAAAIREDTGIGHENIGRALS